MAFVSYNTEYGLSQHSSSCWLWIRSVPYKLVYVTTLDFMLIHQTFKIVVAWHAFCSYFICSKLTFVFMLIKNIINTMHICYIHHFHVDVGSTTHLFIYDPVIYYCDTNILDISVTSHEHLWLLKSWATWLFIHLCRVPTMKTLKLRITGPLWGESTSYWWIPITKGQ